MSSKSIEADLLKDTKVPAPVVDAAAEAAMDETDGVEEPAEPEQDAFEQNAAEPEEPVIPFGGMPAVDISKHAASVDAAVQSGATVKTGGDTTATGMKITAGPGINERKVNEPNVQNARTHDPGHKKPVALEGEQDFSTITLQQFEHKCTELRNAEIEWENQAAIAKKLKETVDNYKAWLLACMKEHKKTSYKSSIGTLIVSKTFTVKLPDSLEKKRAAYKWISEQEGPEKLETMLSINSKTFNKYYREKQEAAFDEGIIDFEIPGVDEPKHIEKFSVRKK